jgi:hypothetical protein
VEVVSQRRDRKGADPVEGDLLEDLERACVVSHPSFAERAQVRPRG